MPKINLTQKGKCSECNILTILKKCIECLKKENKNIEVISESTHSKKETYSELWVDKYSPKDLNSMIGNKNSIQRAKAWIKNYKSKKDKTLPGLLLVGSPGIGKTTLAKNLLKEFDYETVEFNASDIRNQKLVKEKFKNIIGKISITCMMGIKRNIGIIMDEVDGMSSGDKGGMGELISFINPNKGLRKNNKKPLRYNNPIICISNEDFDKKINDLKKECDVIRFVKPKRTELYELVEKICKNEKLDIDDDNIFKIIDYSQLDIRKLICLLEYYSKNSYSEVDKFLKNIDKKNIHINLFDSTLKILTTKLSIENILNIFDEFSLIINQTIHENLLLNYSNFKNSENQKLENLEKNYHSLMLGDMLEGKLYKEHIYEVIEYIGYSTSVSIARNLDTLEKYQYLKDNTITYSKILSKFSIGLNNYKTKIIFQKVFNIVNNLDSCYILFDIFINYLIFDTENFYKIYENKNISLEDIEKIIKIIKTFKINSSYEKDKIINELDKKQIKTLINEFI